MQIQKALELRAKVMLEAMVTPETIIGSVAAVVEQVEMELQQPGQQLPKVIHQHTELDLVGQAP
jgi:hypothetical protein